MSLSSEVIPAPWGLANEMEMCPKDRNLRFLDPSDVSLWDQLLLRHPEASVFHTVGWAKVLRETYRHTPEYLCAWDGKQLSATLPVMEVNSPLTGRRGVALPFSDECQLLSEDSVLSDELIEEVIDFGKKRKWRYLECRGMVGLAREKREIIPSLSFFGHRLALTESEGRIFARFGGSVRRAIRKATRAGVQVEISEKLDALKAYYSLHCQTRRKHGLPTQPFSLFQSIFRHILSKGAGFVAVGKHQGRPIAAAVFFHFDGKATYKFGASDSGLQSLRGNSAVMWGAIKWCCSQSFTSLNFGRTSLSNQGLRRFKLGFGAKEYLIDYFRYNFDRGSFIQDSDWSNTWVNRVIRLLPISVNRMIGALFYKHLS